MHTGLQNVVSREKKRVRPRADTGAMGVGYERETGRRKKGCEGKGKRRQKEHRERERERVRDDGRAGARAFCNFYNLNSAAAGATRNYSNPRAEERA